MTTIVVLVDERPESRAALDWALRALKSSPDPEPPMLHVVLGPSTDIPGGPRYVSPALNDQIAGQLDASGIPHETYLAPKDPAQRVLDLAETVRPDLVVIGMQKRSATLKLFIGSHARDILVDAPCPVVSVKE